MAKGVRGRHDDDENQIGSLPVGDEDTVFRSEGAESGPSNGGCASDAQTGDMGTGSSSSGSVATKGRNQEQKAEAFSRLASIRASNALDAMRGISHLANAKQYAFTRDQIDKMLGALQDSVDALRKGFAVALDQAEETTVEGSHTGRRKRGARQNFSIRV